MGALLTTELGATVGAVLAGVVAGFGGKRWADRDARRRLAVLEDRMSLLLELSIATAEKVGVDARALSIVVQMVNVKGGTS